MQLMTAEEFRNMQDRLGLHYSEMAEYLGCTERTVFRYRQNGVKILPDALKSIRTVETLGINWRERAESAE